uniref:MHC class II beta chain N-terminal domain-containing protein n=1 Tax=Junco hyemalis TaxID=40217 RepID=A0A8C5ILS1_JUNHY
GWARSSGGIFPALTGMFEEMLKGECHFINGTEKVRYVLRFIYNRDQFLMFDSDVGHYVGFTPLGERNAKRFNSDPAELEYRRNEVDRYFNLQSFPSSS